MSNDHTDLDVTDEDQDLDPAKQDARIGSDEVDDVPVSPPDLQPRATEREMAGMPEGEETIEQRIMQEVPDPDSAYGAPDNESGLDSPAPVGGDDPDAIAPEDDFLGDAGAGPAHDDAPAEEVAMHVEGDVEL